MHPPGGGVLLMLLGAALARGGRPRELRGWGRGAARRGTAAAALGPLTVSPRVALPVF